MSCRIFRPCRPEDDADDLNYDADDGIWAHCADIMSYFAHHFDMAAHHCVKIFDTDTHNSTVENWLRPDITNT